MSLQRPLFRLVRLYESEGSVVCRHFESPDSKAGVLWLGGVAGGFDSPAHDLFDHLAAELLRPGVSSLRLRYRYPTDLDLCVEDALVGLEFLGQRGVEKVAIVGYSFGGAVAIRAGGAWPNVVGVATLACQSFGTIDADRLSPRPLLLIHGANDTVLPLECSELIYDRALEPKKMVVIPGAGHCFDETVPELRHILTEWLGNVLTMIRPV